MSNNEKQKKFFEKIGVFIPGYKGYAQREGRRDTDKQLRNKIVLSLSQQKDNLDQILLELTNQNKLNILDSIDRCKKNLEKLIDRIKHLNYGTSGFFDIDQIDEQELEKLYRYDLALAEETKEIIKKTQLLQQSLSAPVEVIKNQSKELLNLIVSIDKNIDTRKQCIIGV